MNFITDNELTNKEIILASYILDHYVDKKFWVFDIYIPNTYSYLIPNLITDNDINNNNNNINNDNLSLPISGIFSKNKNIFLETDNYYIVLENITKEAIIAFNQLEAFYFRFFHYEHEKLNKKDPFFIIASNPHLN